jgi:hypothetical protein
MEWLKEVSVDVAYSSMQMKDAVETQVDHVVPKSWLRQTSVLLEFSTPENDPVNVHHTLKEYNIQKGDLAVLLNARLALHDSKQSGRWAPSGFTVAHQAVIARMVAYMFLTYPLITSDPRVALQRSGAPDYAMSYDAIIQLCAQQPNEEELLKAYVVYGKWGIVNPLVVSDEARAMLQDRNTPLSRLLLARLRGADVCSRAVLDALQDAVSFSDAQVGTSR